jgi:hypothetical protein
MCILLCALFELLVLLLEVDQLLLNLEVAGRTDQLTAKGILHTSDQLLLNLEVAGGNDQLSAEGICKLAAEYS